MRKLSWIGLLCVHTVAAAGGEAALSLAIAEPTFRDPEVLIATSMPPQFEIVFVREMPTPGWSCATDEVRVDSADGRIVVKLTETGPVGAAAQVITPTKCRVPLGQLARGAYLLELWLRRGDDGPHARVQALVVHAR